eukprot:m.270931 g.270931  ORF g.270931 m.270931 type:complete len:104 (+) comp26862_c5_seq6:476-787(+)
MRGAPVEISFAPNTISHPAFTNHGPGSYHAKVNELAGERLADTTVGSYTSKVRAFVLFCQMCGLMTRVSGSYLGAIGSVELPTITPTLLCIHTTRDTRPTTAS